MSTERALGVLWDTEKDCFVYRIKPPDLTNTRRKVMSLVASLYDPIGFLAPFVVRAKIFIQKLWKCPALGWDEEMPPELLRV